MIMKLYGFAFATALLWGLAPVFDKLGLTKATPAAALSVRTATVAVGLLAFVTMSGGWRQVTSLDSRTVAYIAFGALAGGFLGQLTYYYALQLGDASRVVPLAATYPLVAAIVAIVFLKEPLTPGKVVGAIFI
jgi:transporter family protein